ncbi:MAG: IS1 family transposase [Pseudomonadota bacterium]
MWRAICGVTRRTLGWVLGDRSKETCRKLIDKIGLKGRVFATDDYEAYHQIIPEDQLFTGKDLTFPIEQDNSDVRHHLARMTRKTKVVSKSKEMVDISLKLCAFFRNAENVKEFSQKFLPIFI